MYLLPGEKVKRGRSESKYLALDVQIAQGSYFLHNSVFKLNSFINGDKIN